jgi:phosphatidate cytidylyltransferase
VLARAEPSLRWRDLRTRVVSAAFLGPVALACVWFGGAPFHAMIAATTLGLAVEWVVMCGQRPAILPGVCLPAGCVAVAAAAAAGQQVLAVGLVAAMAVVTFVTAARTPHRIGLTLGVPYFGLAAVALIWLRDDPSAGRVNLLVLLALIWASDVGAYLAGRIFGGPRLAPSISPGKTWSGAIGGLLCAVAVGLIAVALSGQQGPHPHAHVLRTVIIAAGFGIIAQLGDLMESRIKRHFGVKDSGWLIPGHGGLLDRVDALLVAAPVAAAVALLVGRGVVLWQ